MIFKYHKIQIKSDFTSWDFNMMNKTFMYYSGHNLWMKQYIKSILYNTYKKIDKNEISIESIMTCVLNNKKIDSHLKTHT